MKVLVIDCGMFDSKICYEVVLPLYWAEFWLYRS